MSQRLTRLRDALGYSDDFYIGEEACALRAARHVMPYVLELTGARSVVDVGCGTGAWLSVAKERGCRVHGYDAYAGPLLIDPDEYTQIDITSGVSCTGFDLACCLEVGEHLPESAAERLVAGLCEADYVLFSAGHPGQRGVHHVNEQWGTWWAELFAEHDYFGTSDVKWAFWENREVADFYRENMILFGASKFLFSSVVDVIHPERLGEWP